MEDLDGLIQQIYRDQDLTQGEEVLSQQDGCHQVGPQPALLCFSVQCHDGPLFTESQAWMEVAGKVKKLV